MKELLIGMGIGFMVGAIVCKTNKCVSDAVGKGVDKGREIMTDIKDEVKTQTNKAKAQEE